MEDIQGAAAGAGPMTRIKEGYGKGFTGDALPNPSQGG